MYQSFEELEIYKAAREFRKKIYMLIKALPAEEKYNLAGQMRRAALSLTNLNQFIPPIGVADEYSVGGSESAVREYQA
jgi:hypothetical protein